MQSSIPRSLKPLTNSAHPNTLSAKIKATNSRQELFSPLSITPNLSKQPLCLTAVAPDLQLIFALSNSTIYQLDDSPDLSLSTTLMVPLILMVTSPKHANSA